MTEPQRRDDDVEPLPEMVSYEIGRAFTGCSLDSDVVLRQRAILQKMLDFFGSQQRIWSTPPKIIHHHNHEATVGPLDYGFKYVVNTMPCGWAAYGALYREKGDQPSSAWYVPEGVQIPNEDS